MALRITHRQSAEPDPIASIAPLDEFPAYKSLIAQQRMLRRAIEDREESLLLISLNREFRDAPSPRDVTDRRETLRERRDELLAKRAAKSKEAAPAPASEDGLDPVVAFGLKIAAGGSVEMPPDIEAARAKLHIELQHLKAADRIVSIQMDEVRAERSFVVNQSLMAQHRSIMKSRLDALLAVAATFEGEAELMAAIYKSGHTPRPDILVSPPVDAANRLGSTAWDSPIATFKRRLEDEGII